jgi:hypothetical protein
MEKEELIKIISKSLKDVYEKYTYQGLLSMYIWGSILTDDFNPETSDIDCIGMVEDDFDLKNESIIQNELALLHPEIKKIGFRVVCKSELNTGISKGNLGLIGNPALLLLDLPTWYWVCGIKFTQNDFNLTVPTFEQALVLRYKNTRERWPDIDLVKPEQVQYLIKQMFRIDHLKQLINNKSEYKIFSYSSVNDGSEIMNICLKIKSSNWNFEEFNKYKNILALSIDG